MAGIGRKNVFWGVRKVLQMCSPDFQIQNDHISWLQEKNIINAKYPNIGYEVRIAFQCASKKIRDIRWVDQNIFQKRSPPKCSFGGSEQLRRIFKAFLRGVWTKNYH